MKRGEIYYADLGRNRGCEQNGVRLVCIVQNDMGNTYSQTTIVCPLTSQFKANLPTHVSLYKGLPRKSTLLAEQIRVVDKKRVFEERLIYILTSEEMEEVDKAIKISLGV